MKKKESSADNVSCGKGAQIAPFQLKCLWGASVFGSFKEKSNGNLFLFDDVRWKTEEW